MINILSLAGDDGLQPKRKAGTNGGEYASPCPGCGGRDRFLIWPEKDKDKGGRYHCRGCEKSGDAIQYLRDFRGMTFNEAKGFLGMEDTGAANVIQPAFKKQPPKAIDAALADKYHAALWETPAAREYLKGRGFTDETIKRFKLGVRREDKALWLSIPHFEGERLVNIKFRSLPPAVKTFQRIPGAKSILFNADALKGREDIFITEGEIDCLTLLQAGVENAVGITCGAGAFDPEWIDRVKHLKKIYICYDMDAAGQAGARSLAKRLGYERVFNIELPDGLDLNEYFCQGKTLADFRELSAVARKFDLPGVISFDTALDRLKEEQARGTYDRGLLTPWGNINRLVKGFNPGDLVIVSAPPKVGKTSLCLQVAGELAIKNYPILFYCLEMRPERLTRKFLQCRYGQELIDQDDLKAAARDFRDLPLYFGHAFKKFKLEETLNLIREAVKRYDLQLVIFDNLHFLIRGIQNTNEELGQAVQGFKLLAEELEIPVIVIAQPRKKDGAAADEIMRADDIKYSNAVHADCDLMILLHRKRRISKVNAMDLGKSVIADQALDSLTQIRVEAHRYGAGGDAFLDFKGDISKFEEVKP